MTTTLVKVKEIQRRWHEIDASKFTLGRLAAATAKLLIGKHKPEYTPFLDCGDQVVVINSAEIRVTGKKAQDKTYAWHTGYPRGYREISFEKLMAYDPGEVLSLAVRGMLPKNKTQKRRLKRLFVYPGQEHPHLAQKPVTLN